jgi:hypothetical protein
MSTLSVSNVQGPGSTPVNFPFGITIGSAGGAGSVNNIGTAGQQGFGVGIAPEVPTGFTAMSGTTDPASANYGNYQYSDGSVMCYIPAFFYKYGTGSNGLAVNLVDIKPFAAFETVAAANAAGYALHRAFYNGGSIRPGFFIDKYIASNNGGIASSIKNGVALSSAVRGGVANTAFASLTGAPANALHGAIVAAKTRGSQFFCKPLFMRAALALLSLAHGQASTNTTFNAWYSSGSTNFQKGNNNNALGDTNDAAIAYLTDGTTGVTGRTGSANFFARTCHNGQACGVADLNGVVWEVEPGLTSNGTNFYLLKTAANMATVTSGNTLNTDLWGATGYAALYDDLGTTFEALTGSVTNKVMGSAGQVLSSGVSGTAWAAAGSGLPLAGGVGGSNAFGSDFFYDAKPNELCAVGGGSWDSGSFAGVWALILDFARGDSVDNVGFRAASYL